MNETIMDGIVMRHLGCGENARNFPEDHVKEACLENGEPDHDCCAQAGTGHCLEGFRYEQGEVGCGWCGNPGWCDENNFTTVCIEDWSEMDAMNMMDGAINLTFAASIVTLALATAI